MITYLVNSVYQTQNVQETEVQEQVEQTAWGRARRVIQP